jgi:hypothetical protein
MHRLLLPALFALIGTAQAASITYEFSGSLNTVYADATAASSPAPVTLLGGGYSGTLEYDSATGNIISGQIQFASGYGVNNYGSPAPTYAQSQWTWGDTTYELTGNVLTAGGTAMLLIGNDLNPLVHNASSPEVQAMGTSNLVQAIAGPLPICTAFLPSSQDFVCSYAPPAEVMGLDSLKLVIDPAAGSAATHQLKFDEIIGHCGHECDTGWYQFSGVGTGTVSTVPVPAAVWLFGSALGMLGWRRRKT